MHHVGTKQIETTRLILRKFCEEDIEPSFRNWTNDPNVTTYLRWETHSHIEITKEVLSQWIAGYEKPEFYQWAIVLKDIQEVIGTISVVDQKETLNIVHIGYCIGSKWWHQGVVSEAFAAIIPFLFEEVGANRIESLHDPRNPNSGAVMKKCGLTFEGILRQRDFNNQGIVDAAMYALLACDYAAMNHKDK